MVLAYPSGRGSWLLTKDTGQPASQDSSSSIHDLG